MRAGKDARGLLTAHQAKGAGYAISRPEELQTVIEVAESTGAAQPHSSMRTLLTHLYTIQGTSFLCQQKSSKHASDMPWTSTSRLTEGCAAMLQA